MRSVSFTPCTVDQLITLETILKTMVQGESVDVIRMDVEGAEWDVLQTWLDSGAFRKGRVKQLLLEAHFFHPEQTVRQGTILAAVAKQMRRFWLAANGYRAFQLNRDGVKLDVSLVCADAYELGFVA